MRNHFLLHVSHLCAQLVRTQSRTMCRDNALYIHTYLHARIQEITFQKEGYLGMALNSEVPNTLPPEMQFSKSSFFLCFRHAF